MVFRKLFGALGVGAPSVDTVLSTPDVRPGLPVTGHVHITGGTQPAELSEVTVALVTRVEVEHGDEEYDTLTEFGRVRVSGPMTVPPGASFTLPFQLPVPWETPVTHVYGQPLHGMTMGVRTELAIMRSIDKGDLDPVRVHPLRAQELILDAFAQLGFGFARADLERGHLAGVHQHLPFYQEIEFHPAHRYAHEISELELTFVADPHQVEVIIEFDKRGGLFREGGDAYSRYTVPHAGAEHVDWVAEVDGWVRAALDRHRSRAAGHGHHGGHGHAEHGYGHPGHGHGAHGDGGWSGHHDDQHGPGLGTAAAVAGGVAVGAVGGFLAAEVLDDVVEEFIEDPVEEFVEEFFDD